MFTQFLAGKTAIVTGSLSGIGLGIAKSLSAAGANIVLNGFAPEAEIAQLEKELSGNGKQAKFIFADLMKPADGKALVEKSIAHFGKVDILVNNAGIQHIDAVENFPEDKWDNIIALNLSSNFHTIKHALPGMKQRGWGRIINIASVHGLVGSINKSAYVAAKHGVVGLTKVVALENAQSGVTCNAICPGFVLTPLIQKQIELKSQQHKVSIEEAQKILVTEKQPSGNLSSPEDVGNLVTYLTSDSASQIQGVAYTIDGAWTAQ